MIYEIHMSKGQNIKIDEQDLAKIKENISENLIMIKHGIINPSFMVSITPTNESDFIIKPKIEIENGIAKIVGEEKIARLANEMSANKLLK